MKLFIVVACAAFGMVQAAWAQEPFSVGVRAGFNYATLKVDDGSASYGYQPGYHVGLFASYRRIKSHIQAEVMYSKQGASIQSSGEDLTSDARYINVPVLYRYDITNNFNVHIGPQVGFLTCVESDYHPVTHEPFQSQDYTTAYKKTDFGALLGVGWETDSGITVDLRYYLGLTDISNYEGLFPTKNSMLQFSIGYKFYKF